MFVRWLYRKILCVSKKHDTVMVIVLFSIQIDANDILLFTYKTIAFPNDALKVLTIV